MRAICYALSILLKIMHLSQSFFCMLKIKAMMKVNVSYCYGNDLKVFMNQYH